MKFNLLKAAVLFFIGLIVLIGIVQLGTRASAQTPTPTPSAISPQPNASSLNSGVPFGCAIQPNPNPTGRTEIRPRPIQVPLSRFRQITPKADLQSALQPTAYNPREVVELADPTNFGERFIKDLNGQVVTNQPIIVIHETVGSARSAINYFQTPHPLDADQVSYHSLIGLDGTIYYLVPPDKRAFGAGNSVFAGIAGTETVKTHPDFPPSVNNFAYHISLETPADGDNNNTSHSGYTNAQYQSLAWLSAKTGVPNDRITFHKTVDRSGSRMDPRSFNADTFFRVLDGLPKTQEIVIGCAMPSGT